MGMRLVATCLILVLSACAGGGSGGDGGDSDFDPDASFDPDSSLPGDGDGDGDGDADAGPTLPPESQLIGPEGGTISAYGLTLEFPPGALKEPVEISIAVQGGAPAGYETYSMVWDVGPDGLRLGKPATARMAFQGDAALAAAFWTAKDNVELLGGVVQGGELVTQVEHFSAGWVGNVLSVPPRHAEPDCGAVVRLVHGGPLPENENSSAVAAVVAVEDCNGVPLHGLTANDFVPAEDGLPLSVEAHGFTVLEHRPAIHFVVTLALDFSSSTDGMREEVIAGARAFVDRIEAANVPVLIGVLPFAGADPILNNGYGPRELLPPTTEYDLVRAKLDALVAYQAADPGATNLNGAIEAAYEHTAITAHQLERRNQGGAFAVPLVVVFTDGRDTAGRGGSVPPGSTFAVALQSPDYDRAALETLIGGSAYADNLFELASASELEQHFARIAALLASRIEGAYYRVGYCSPTREGSHSFTLQIAGASSTSSDSHTFDARSGACTADLFVTACDEHACGGFGCGGCDDRESVCNGRECVSWCETLGICTATEINNPLGHAQSCTPSDCAGAVQPVFYAVGEEPGSSAMVVSTWTTEGQSNVLRVAPNGDIIQIAGGARRYDMSGELIWTSNVAILKDYSSASDEAVIAPNGDLYVDGSRLDLDTGEVLWTIEGEDDPMLLTVDGGIGLVRSTGSLLGESTIDWFDADGLPAGTTSLGETSPIEQACSTSDGGFWLLLNPFDPGVPTYLRRVDGDGMPGVTIERDEYGISLVCTASSAFVAMSDSSEPTAVSVLELRTDGQARTVMEWTGHVASGTTYFMNQIAARDDVVAAVVHHTQESIALEETTVVLARRQDNGYWSYEEPLMDADGYFGTGGLDIVGARAVAVQTGYSAEVSTLTLFKGEPDETSIRHDSYDTVLLLHDDYTEVAPVPGF